MVDPRFLQTGTRLLFHIFFITSGGYAMIGDERELLVDLLRTERRSLLDDDDDILNLRYVEMQHDLRIRIFTREKQG